MAKETGKLVAEFVREKETKNTVRFDEQPVKGAPPIIGGLYVQKFAAGDAKRIRVTVEVIE